MSAPREFTASRTILIVVFAISFAAIEGAVVHYLHMHFYPDGFSFPLQEMSPHFLGVEVTRELGTIIVMFTVAFLAHGQWWGRFAWFMIIFGVWDIFYYVWLLVFEGWPPSLMTPDILFLIPAPWAGPVLSPVLVSIGLIVSGMLVLYGLDRGISAPGKRSWIPTLLGWGIILGAFLQEASTILETNDAGPFNWWLFGFGMLIWAGGIAAYAGKTRSGIDKPSGAFT